jgi:hypothetical protein
MLFSAREAGSEYKVLEVLDLETGQDMTALIAKYGPQVIMTLSRTESNSCDGLNFGGYNKISGSVFDIKITLLAKVEIVRRGNLDVRGDKGIDIAVKKSMRRLIDQCKIDQLT